jgi:hypothetical protein
VAEILNALRRGPDANRCEIPRWRVLFRLLGLDLHHATSSIHTRGLHFQFKTVFSGESCLVVTWEFCRALLILCNRSGFHQAPPKAYGPPIGVENAKKIAAVALA